MPCFIITSPAHREGQATLCDAGPLGHPDRRTDVPVKVAITETTVTVDDEATPRRIISSTGLNGSVTYLVDGSSAGLIHRERRAQLAHVLMQLDRLRDAVLPLRDQSKHASLVNMGLGELYQFLTLEREDLEGGGRGASKGASVSEIIAKRETR